MHVCQARLCAVYVSIHRSVAMSLWSADKQYPRFVGEDNAAWTDRVTCPRHRAEVAGQGRVCWKPAPVGSVCGLRETQ